MADILGLTRFHLSCWCAVGNEGMNLGIPVKETTRDGLQGSFLGVLCQHEMLHALVKTFGRSRCGKKRERAGTTLRRANCTR